MKFDQLHSKFEKIKEEWAEDSLVEFEFKNKNYSADLGKISMEIPFQHNKYLNHYTDLSQIKTSLEFEVRKLVREKREYYSGEAEAKVYAEKPFGSSIKTSDKMKVYLESDEDIINQEAKIKYIDQMLFFLDNVLKMISQRNYHVKNAIEWEKFINGN
ncbi:MAG: recombination mediator protein UvsY [Candidatus Nanopelagicaceae bacterium]